MSWFQVPGTYSGIKGNATYFLESDWKLGLRLKDCEPIASISLISPLDAGTAGPGVYTTSLIQEFLAHVLACSLCLQSLSMNDYQVLPLPFSILEVFFFAVFISFCFSAGWVLMSYELAGPAKRRLGERAFSVQNNTSWWISHFPRIRFD